MRREFIEFELALRELFMTIAEELGIPKLVAWLAEKIEALGGES